MTPAPGTIPHLLPRADGRLPLPFDQNPGTSSFAHKVDRTIPPFTSRPLPSFQERSYHYQPYPYGPQYHKQPQERSFKRNPTHDTRAFQLPTPYVGPPKKPPGRPKKKRVQSPDIVDDDIQIIEPESQGVGPSGSHTTGQTSELYPTPSSSQTSQEPSIAPPFDMAQNAVILAALSAVNSGNANTSTSSLPQDAPNEALVAFLKAYLTVLETPKPTSDTNVSPAPGITSSVPQASLEEPASRKSLEHGEVRNSTDKENVKPSRELQARGKDINETIPSASVSPTRATPLGPGRFNSRTDLTTINPGSNASTSDEPQSSEGVSRKRTLSEAMRLDEVASRSKRNANRSSADGGGLSPRVNSGWGGLRIRSEGSLSTSQLFSAAPPRSNLFAEPQASSPQVAYFKASCTTTTTSVRKGPFVVPTWAQNVPPPLPPRRPEEQISEVQQIPNSSKAKKRIKSKKSLGRLGGQQTARKVSNGHTSSSGLAPSPDLRAPLPPMKKENPTTPKTSPLRSPGLRMPVFAQSSPAVKTSYTTLFQAFQTSPCRPPRLVGESPRRNEPPRTPRRPVSRSPKSCSASGFPGVASLFTPSPANTSLGPRTGHQSFFDMAPDPPPSPTPSKRNTRILEADTEATPTSHSIAQTRNDISEQSGKEKDEIDEPPSSLPVASSEPDYESSVQPSSSSSFTVTSTSFRIHDWSALDLPPSSPPLPSSPALLADDMDLPGSDLPSSDFDFGETPSSTSDADGNSAAATPQESAEQPVSFTLDGNFTGMEQFLSDWDFPDFDLNAGAQEGTAADEALDALRNGIGQEDFSEAWNLLNSVLQIPNIDPAVNATTDGSDLLNLSQTSETSSEYGTDAEFGDGDYASLVASNFEDLLKGCLV